jgi:hypothetical protein
MRAYLGSMCRNFLISNLISMKSAEEHNRSTPEIYKRIPYSAEKEHWFKKLEKLEKKTNYYELLSMCKGS